MNEWARRKKLQVQGRKRRSDLVIIALSRLCCGDGLLISREKVLVNLTGEEEQECTGIQGIKMRTS